MNVQTVRELRPGPVGPLEVAVDAPAADVAPRGLAVLCHPHPLHGGTLDNKVVQTLARAVVHAGWQCVRLNYRGVGRSAGAWDGGPGETDDAQCIVTHFRQAGQPLLLAGFSFGGHVAACLAQRLAEQGIPARRLILIGPATANFPVPPVAPDTLVVHGEVDEVVPLQATLDWARPQALPVVVVPGVGHFFHGQLPLLKSLVGRWLAPDLS